MAVTDLRAYWAAWRGMFPQRMIGEIAVDSLRRDAELLGETPDDEAMSEAVLRAYTREYHGEPLNRDADGLPSGGATAQALLTGGGRFCIHGTSDREDCRDCWLSRRNRPAVRDEPCVHNTPVDLHCVPCQQARDRASRRNRPAIEAERRTHVVAELDLLVRIEDLEMKLAGHRAQLRDYETLLESQRRTIAVQKENLTAQDEAIATLRGSRVAPKWQDPARYGVITLTAAEIEAARQVGDAFVKLAELEVNAAIDQAAGLCDLEIQKLIQHPSGGFSFPPVVVTTPGPRFGDVREDGPSAIPEAPGVAPKHRLRAHNVDGVTPRPALVIRCQNEED